MEIYFEKAPWWGATGSGLFKVLSVALKTIRQSRLTYDELATVLTEIESKLNNRPLTYFYGDDKGLSYAVTPADLIYGHRIESTSSNQEYEVVTTARPLTK